MNSKFLLAIIVVVSNINLIYGQLSCSYNTTYFGYTCFLSINNPSGLNNFASIGGTHLPGYSDTDVKKVEGVSGSNTANVPSIICQKFSNSLEIDLRGLYIQRVDDYSFNDCTKIVNINLYINQITSVSANAFSRNLDLEYIYLLFNQLTSLTENVFLNQNKLLWLSLWNNRISDPPKYLFKGLINLHTLWLENNQIRNIKVEWFETLQKLDQLILDGNYITDIPKNAFNKLTNIRLISLLGNNLKMIHADSFGFLPKFESLNFRDNQINAIDENIVNYTILNNINLIGNLCANRQITDNSVSRYYMRAEMGQCFINYENAMSGKCIYKKQIY